MLLKFYDNIFASSYKLYSKYYVQSKAIFRAKTIVAVHLSGLLFLLLALSKRILNLDFTALHSISAIIGILLLVLTFAGLTKYFTNAKTDSILHQYDNYPNNQRKLWGVINFTTLLVEYVIVALLLTK